MNLQTDNIRKLYFRYLFPCLFSGLITSIYTLVDMIVVGQYEGPAGTAAMACITPFWTFFCCLSVLFGSGGAVLFSTAKGEGNEDDSKSAFTVSFVLICAISALVWVTIILLDKPLLRLFGTNDTLIPLALRYMKWLKWGIPLYPIGYYLGMFVRNDGAPTLAGASIICGGVFNIFADVFLTFICDLGIEGAAIATLLGQAIAVCILLSHFFSRKNTITFVKISAFTKWTKEIMSIGASSFLCDVGVGVLIILFNNQIVRYLGNNELAVFGVASNIFVLIQTFSYGIGNAAQPILAENFGAGNTDRVAQTKRFGIETAAIIGVIAVTVTLLLPTQIVRIYIDASAEILDITPFILRRYFLCLLFVPLNVFATYYLQAVQRVKESVLLSVLRGFILGVIFVFLFPMVLGAGAIWYVMAAAEFLTALLAVWMFRRPRL